MRTVADDLTARARIRDAAIDLFGQQGFDVGLRTIADHAGVSLGLIRHHFGTKEDLRDACDKQVLRDIRAAKEGQFLDADPAAQMLDNMAHVEAYAPLIRYLLQAMRVGGNLARQFFERMSADAVEYTEKAVAEGVLVPSRDPAARADFLTKAVLGGALLSFTLNNETDPQRAMRHWLDEMALPALELYTNGLFTHDGMLQAYLTHAHGDEGVQP